MTPKLLMVWFVPEAPSLSPNPVSFQVGQEEEDESDIFAIREVSFQSVGESEWKDTNYTLNTDSLDWVSPREAGRALGPAGRASRSGEGHAASW